MSVSEGSNPNLKKDEEVGGVTSEDKRCGFAKPSLIRRFDIHSSIYLLVSEFTGVCTPAAGPLKSNIWGRKWSSGFAFLIAIAHLLEVPNIPEMSTLCDLFSEVSGLKKSEFEENKIAKDVAAWISFGESIGVLHNSSKTCNSQGGRLPNGSPAANLLFRGVYSLAYDCGILRCRARNGDMSKPSPYAELSKEKNVCSHLIYIRHMVQGTGGTGISVSYYLFSLIVGISTGRWAWSAPELTGLPGSEDGSIFGTKEYHSKKEMRAAMGSFPEVGSLPQLKDENDLPLFAYLSPDKRFTPSNNPILSRICHDVVRLSVTQVALITPSIPSFRARSTN